MDSHVDGKRTHASVLRCSKYLVTQSLHLLIGNCHRTLECHSHSSVEHQPNMPCTVYNQDPKRARNITTGHPWPCILAMQSHTQAAPCPLQRCKAAMWRRRPVANRVSTILAATKLHSIW